MRSLSLLSDGRIAYQLKKRWRDGTTAPAGRIDALGAALDGRGLGTRSREAPGDWVAAAPLLGDYDPTILTGSPAAFAKFTMCAVPLDLPSQNAITRSGLPSSSI